MTDSRDPRSAAATAQDVIDFWLQAGPQKWFAKDDGFDRLFRDTFHDLHFKAARRELASWMDSAEGALALLILLDQYPRNAYRDTAHMFATDPLARYYARQMLDRSMDAQIEPALRAFCYLPFEHSEQSDDQDLSMSLYAALDAESYKWAKVHADIISRFGRFPHRNHVLARQSTAEEQTFLEQGGFSG